MLFFYCCERCDVIVTHYFTKTMYFLPIVGYQTLCLTAIQTVACAGHVAEQSKIVLKMVMAQKMLLYCVTFWWWKLRIGNDFCIQNVILIRLILFKSSTLSWHKLSFCPRVYKILRNSVRLNDNTVCHINWYVRRHYLLDSIV